MFLFKEGGEQRVDAKQPRTRQAYLRTIYFYKALFEIIGPNRLPEGEDICFKFLFEVTCVQMAGFQLQNHFANQRLVLRQMECSAQR